MASICAQLMMSLDSGMAEIWELQLKCQSNNHSSERSMMNIKEAATVMWDIACRGHLPRDFLNKPITTTTRRTVDGESIFNYHRSKGFRVLEYTMPPTALPNGLAWELDQLNGLPQWGYGGHSPASYGNPMETQQLPGFVTPMKSTVSSTEREMGTIRNMKRTVTVTSHGKQPSDQEGEQATQHVPRSAKIKWKYEKRVALDYPFSRQ